MYIKRVITDQLIELLNIFPAIAVTGPRQAGKSTLLQHTLPNYTYVTFDDFRARAFIEEDPAGFIEKYNTNVIFDEAQKAPEVFNLVKVAIDKNRKKYGNFILTGSSHFSFIRGIKESLAGRIGLLSLLPLQFLEVPKAAHTASLYKGAYPELVERNYKGFHHWYSSYLDTYLTRDITDLIQLTDLTDFRRLISLLAANVSQTLNMSTYAKEIGVTVQTIRRWLTALEASYIIFTVQPYFDNLGKRIIKSPKLYFYDTGLVSYLTYIESEEQFKKGPMAGHLFENYIISEIMKNECHHGRTNRLYFYRTSEGQEIDLIINQKNKRSLIEIKATSTPKRSHFKQLESLKKEADELYLIYNGETFEYGKKMIAINYQEFLENLN